MLIDLSSVGAQVGEALALIFYLTVIVSAMLTIIGYIFGRSLTKRYMPKAPPIYTKYIVPITIGVFLSIFGTFAFYKVSFIQPRVSNTRLVIQTNDSTDQEEVPVESEDSSLEDEITEENIE